MATGNVFLTESEAALKAEFAADDAAEATAKAEAEAATEAAAASAAAVVDTETAAAAPAVETSAAPIVDDPTVIDLPSSSFPVLTADAGDAEAQIVALKAQRATLRAQFDEGELTRAELDAQLDDISDKLAEQQAAIRNAEFARINNDNSAKQIVTATVEIYRQNNPDLQNETVNAAWDAAVREIAKDTANANLSLGQMLRKAHLKVRDDFAAAFGVELPGTTKPAVPTDAPAAPAAPASSAQPKRTAPAAPATLHNIPQTVQASVAATEFSKIDSLEGIAAEAEYRKMTAEQRERWLASQ